MHYFDLELGPMTLILKLDLDMLVTYLHAKNEVNRSSGAKVIIRIHTQKDRQMGYNHYLPAYAGGKNHYLAVYADSKNSKRKL